MPAETIEYERLGRELLRALRGRRSQEALGRRMRFTSNVLYAWESGRRQPTASVLFRMALSVGLDVAPGLQAALFGVRLVTLSSKRLATRHGIADLLRELVREAPVAGIARVVGVDRGTITRWLSGQSEPRLPQLLRAIDATTLRLLDVLEHFTDPAKLASVRTRYRNLKAQRALAFDVPFSHAALRALELSSYHSDDRDDAHFVAASTGISPEHAVDVLRALASAGQIRKRGGRYRIADVMTVDTRTDIPRDIALKRHWAQVATDRIDAQRLRKGALASYNVFAASAEAYQQIHKLQLDYYDQVRRIVASDTRADRVVLLNMHLFPLDA